MLYENRTFRALFSLVDLGTAKCHFLLQYFCFMVINTKQYAQHGVKVQVFSPHLYHTGKCIIMSICWYMYLRVLPVLHRPEVVYM